MERITPIDLESARFPLVRKGYDTNAVDAMLKTASAELDAVRRELQELRQRHEIEKKELELFRSKESTLADALILAQKTADETRAAAHKEGELIIEHAKRQADDVRRAAKDEMADLERKIEQRMQDKKSFEARFRSLLNDYLRSLDDAPVLKIEERDAAAG
jgi:cell division initiation protein